MALTQPEHQPLPLAEQVAVLVAVTGGHMDDISLADLPAFEQELLQYLRTECQALCAEINRAGELGDAIRSELESAIGTYRETRNEDRSA